MSFYPQFPAIYAYPMPFPNQEFYPLYPPNGQPGGPGGPNAGSQGMEGSMYYDNGILPQSIGPQGGNLGSHRSHPPSVKIGYKNRKDSADSGISDFSGTSSRKTSNTSVISNASSILEESSLDDVEEEPPFEEPDDDLCEKIVQQVEFYFSDANITKDKFLLKHVKRNKEGFVSLKLISSFKRVKHLTKDWRQVADAIERKSKLLEVNDLKTKVRRLDALPEYDETTPSRTVVALNLPLNRPTIEGVAEIFKTCGDIVLIRILRPGNPIPADIKPFVNKHPEMVAKVCALVEFERTEFALKAVRELSDTFGNVKQDKSQSDDEGKDGEEEEKKEKMKVMELTAPPAKTSKKDDKKKMSKQQHHQAPTSSQHSGPLRRFSHAGMTLPPHHQNNDQVVLGPRRRISLLHNMKFSSISEEQQKKEYSLNPNAPTFQMQHHGMSHNAFVHAHNSAVEAAAESAAAEARHKVRMQYAAATAAVHQHAANHPWMQHRRISVNEIASSGLALPANVMRLPRGPDKGKGFQRWCRNRMESNTSSSNNGISNSGAIPRRKSHALPIIAPPKEDLERDIVKKEKTPERLLSAEKEKEKKQLKPETEKESEEKQEDKLVSHAKQEQEQQESDDAGAAIAASAAVAVVPAVDLSDDEIAVDAAAESCSDSGNEDGGYSEHEVEMLENERIR